MRDMIINTMTGIFQFTKIFFDVIVHMKNFGKF